MNGEVYQLTWEYSLLVDKYEEIRLKYFLRTTKTPFFIQKIFTIKSNILALYVEEKLINLGREKFEFQWRFYLNVGSNFLDENCVFDMPATDINTFLDIKSLRIEKDEIGKWPILKEKNRSNVDLSKMVSKNSGI